MDSLCTRAPLSRPCFFHSQSCKPSGIGLGHFLLRQASRHTDYGHWLSKLRCLTLLYPTFTPPEDPGACSWHRWLWAGFSDITAHFHYEVRHRYWGLSRLLIRSSPLNFARPFPLPQLSSRTSF